MRRRILCERNCRDQNQDRIVSLHTTHNWFAIYAAENGEESAVPLVGWAVAELCNGRPHRRCVIGVADIDMCGAVLLCEERPGFRRYVKANRIEDMELESGRQAA